MHKVLNYGSALQAYALQQKLLSMGYDNELIDYKYPNPEKKRHTLKSILCDIVIFLRNAIIGFPTERKQRRFNKFYDKNFKLSEFYTRDTIISNPPQYDAYITGSDQVWNPKFAGTDANFFLAFAPNDKLKFSYASSFATKEVTDNMKALYAKYLSRYDSISVREVTGVDIVRKLIGRDATVCCDPTILLTSDEWDKLAVQSTYDIKYKYILVYVLHYMIGNVFDEVQKITDYVQKTLGLKVIYLIGRKEDAFRPNSRLIKDAGPAEFLYLIKNAEFVITTSFHGVAFSLIYHRPLFGVVDKQKVDDGRIQSILNITGASNSTWDYRQVPDLAKEDLMRLKGDENYINKLRMESSAYLSKALNKLTK